MALVTDGLINQLDAEYVRDVGGFVNGQNLIGAFLPDSVDADGWYGSDGYDCYLRDNAITIRPSLYFNTGVITPQNTNKYLTYENLTVIIAARRQGPAWGNQWMGLYSSWFNYNNNGASIFAITNNANVGGFDRWGTYGGITTTQSTSAMNVDVPVVLSTTFTSSGSGVFYTNGSNSGTYTSTKDQAYFGIGGLLPAKGSFVGDVFEVLVYNRILSEAEIQDSTNYLINKWFFYPSPTPSITPTITSSISITPTPSVTPSITPSQTPPITPSITTSVTPTFSPSVTPTLTPSVTPTATPVVTDAIKSALSGTDLTNYNNASVNDWVKIGAGNYNNVFVTLSNTTKYGVTDVEVNTRSVATSYSSRDIAFESLSAGIPTNLYLIGFIAEPWNQNGTVKIGYTTTYKGIPQYISTDLAINGGVRNYYIRKAPSSVEFAPSSQPLYPVLYMSVSPNATLNTNGWNSGDNGATWSPNILNVATPKLQLFTTTTKQW